MAANRGYLGGPIPIALLMGIYNQFIRPGHIGEMSLIGCVLLLVALVYGRTVAETPEAGSLRFPQRILLLLNVLEVATR